MMREETFCGECGCPKKSKFCDFCHRETSNLFKKKFSVVEKAKIWTKQFMKSKEKVRNKSEREIEQWTSKKNENIITRYDRLREECKPTKVVHSLWRRIGGIWKKIHEDKKS